MPGRFYVGTSGWHYDHWRGNFYPQDLAKTGWLEHYAAKFNTVELNNSFYRLPSEKAFTAWREATPANFLFSVKVSRFITHVKRLREAGEAEERFITRARLLGDKLGPLLYQLPPGMRRDDERLESFLSILTPGMKHVFEFRHESWFDDAVFKLLRKYGAGFCFFDMPGVSCPFVVTAEFAYIRFHGRTGLYSRNYPDDELSAWADRIKGLSKNVEAWYVYFNNDAGGYAVKNAVTLRFFLGASS